MLSLTGHHRRSNDSIPLLTRSVLRLPSMGCRPSSQLSSVGGPFDHIVLIEPPFSLRGKGAFGRPQEELDSFSSISSKSRNLVAAEAQRHHERPVAPQRACRVHEHGTAASPAAKLKGTIASGDRSLSTFPQILTCAPALSQDTFALPNNEAPAAMMRSELASRPQRTRYLKWQASIKRL